jgi:hypothetical protein
VFSGRQLLFLTERVRQLGWLLPGSWHTLLILCEMLLQNGVPDLVAPVEKMFIVSLHNGEFRTEAFE